MNGALVDTGFLVALFRRRDRLRSAARDYLKAHTHPLATVAPVIVEASFFLDASRKADLLEWIARGGLALVDVPLGAFPELKAIIAKYADRDIDFAEAALIWFAGNSGCRRILTVDRADFDVYRLKGNRRFDLLQWFP